eukprot:scaffold148638_cov41-Tisochrysis_lutea.AAC.1
MGCCGVSSPQNSHLVSAIETLLEGGGGGADRCGSWRLRPLRKLTLRHFAHCALVAKNRATRGFLVARMRTFPPEVKKQSGASLAPSSRSWPPRSPPPPPPLPCCPLGAPNARKVRSPRCSRPSHS